MKDKKQQSGKPGNGDKNFSESKEKKGDKCDYLHPEECENVEKQNLDETRQEVEKQFEKFIDKENSSKEG